MKIIVRCIYYMAVTPSCDILCLGNDEWQRLLWSTPQERKQILLPMLYRKWGHARDVREVLWIPYDGQDKITIVEREDETHERANIARIGFFGNWQYEVFVVTDDEIQIPHFHIRVLGNEVAVNFSENVYLPHDGKLDGNHFPDKMREDLAKGLADFMAQPCRSPKFESNYEFAACMWNMQNDVQFKCDTDSKGNIVIPDYAHLHCKETYRGTEEWELYKSNLPLLYRNREAIYRRREWFLARTPITIYGITSPITIGTILKLWDSGSKYFHCKCRECGSAAYVYGYAGNPMTGTTTISCCCFRCGNFFTKRTDGWTSRTKALAQAIKLYQADIKMTAAISLNELVEILRLNETNKSVTEYEESNND